MESIRKVLATNLVKKRKDQLKISRERLAELSGISTSTIERIERNKQDTEIGTIEALAIALNCTFIDLVLDKDHKAGIIDKGFIERIISADRQVLTAIEALLDPTTVSKQVPDFDVFQSETNKHKPLRDK